MSKDRSEQETQRVYIRDSHTPTVEKGSATPKVEPLRTTSSGDKPPASDKD